VVFHIILIALVSYHVAELSSVLKQYVFSKGLEAAGNARMVLLTKPGAN